MAWIQLIFTSSPQQAESLSDALSECGAAAVTFQDNADQPIYEPAIGETPLWSATSVIALFDAETDTEALLTALRSQIGELPDHRIEAVEDKDWEREWMENFKPICFGEKLWIVPSWHEPPQPDAINILLDPGLAFGTGTHPTTALCLQWLDKVDLTGKTVIDYGCGSGILAIAAALLGADKVIGVDTDPQALEATQANAQRNGVIIETYLPQHCPTFKCDLLLANILAGPLMELMPRFIELTRPDTQLVLSGILDVQADAVSQHYQSEFEMDKAVVLEEWVRLSGVRHG
ncbi:50S ribosomal protein L11 methyltransferase [Methylophaga sp.]|uniref:50S ribosomal protein L11 methyltransferase n=1 Tax=Methylophaga sp. TaxID=2024840 RepID=UPI0025EB6B6E|nr:50S ribosomal protein L11 methyltransferase [Methylophaga sp.]